ncbi:MAG TPA: deoxyribose-phosphate aldolase, partial [Treponema sp.]|nr:deoxyribose-phosphate aldolase [Treponema sp.]
MEDERPAAKISPEDIAKYIDHTMLRPEAATAAFDQLCEEALRYGFYGVCVNSGRVAYVARRLKGTAVKVCSVVGFPLGAMTSAAKAFEAGEAIRCGASEIDMVINVGLLKSGDLAGVEADIRAVREATKADTVLKVIIETALLSDVEKVMACELSKK